MVPVTLPSRSEPQKRRSRTTAITSGAVPTHPNDQRFQSGNAKTSSKPEKIASDRLLMNGVCEL